MLCWVVPQPSHSVTVLQVLRKVDFCVQEERVSQALWGSCGLLTVLYTTVTKSHNFRNFFTLHLIV